MIAVAVGHVQLVGLLIDEQLRRPLEIIDVVAALALARMPDLHQELPILRELQNLVIAEVGRTLAASRTLLVRQPLRLGRRRASPVSADPNVALVIHRDPVVRFRPIVAGTGAAPMPDQIAIFVEFENRRRGLAALRSRRIGLHVGFFRIQRPAAVDNPNMVLGVNRHADSHAEQPVVGQRLWPHGIHFKPGRHHTGGLNRLSFEHQRGNSKRRHSHRKTHANTEIPSHTSHPPSFRCKLLFTGPRMRQPLSIIRDLV